MADVRKTVGVYEKPERRGISARTVAVAVVLAIAALSGAAVVLLF